MKRKATLATGQDYHLLYLQDLLEAREAYHVFLTRKRNVVGTAIGKWFQRKPGVARGAPKTLENTEVSDYAWPCLLVFVNKWVPGESFGKSEDATNDDYIPRFLYLPSGREVPVCVLLADWVKSGNRPIGSLRFPASVVGGGFPIMSKVQGERRWATLGCLVSDGRTMYGLTNAHVTGKPGEILYTQRFGNDMQIGISSPSQLQRKPFEQVYEGLPGKHTIVNLDIGLVEFDNVHDVTSQIYGIGAVRGLADVNHATVSLDLIGCPVKGFGCVSGIMQGQILGLYYRYKNPGGYDCVSDYLIGPRIDNGKVRTSFAPTNGDSGTLLVVDDRSREEHMKAIGVIWGGQRSVSDGKVWSYGLATNLATICSMLDVELVCDWNAGFDRYFGAYAHFALPSLCSDVVKNRNLRQLMKNNEPWYCMPLSIAVKETQGQSKSRFVRLADVPDLVWKKKGGAYNRYFEGPNHFANLDQPNTEGWTLLDICKDEKNVSIDVWLKHYNELKLREKGALPFRIAQVYQAMLEARDKARFVCAAGILTHYVLDACMPLHVSYMHHGDPGGPKKMMGGKEVPVTVDVHAEFDNQVVEYHSQEITEKLPLLVKKKSGGASPIALGEIKTWHDAAVGTMRMMRNMMIKYGSSPKKIIADFEQLLDAPKRERCDKLWETYKNGMLATLAEGVIFTARLWEAAWVNGAGKNIKDTAAVPEDALLKLYETKSGFLDSVKLEDFKKILT
jgi:hypothetical protein